jgi:PilZ domain
VDVVIDGNPALLIDLSNIGAQVVSPVVLKPNQRVRMALTDDNGNVRFNALVAWASFEIPPKMGPRYRAGLEFVDADKKAVDSFRARHQQK